MGFVGGLLGTAGGAGGTGFGSPQQANIVSPVTATQATTSYNDVQNSIQQQQNLLAALQGQNGLQNQSNIYNQLQQVAAGQGPNPAQAQLAQATGANVANQAALMAGQRGASQNAGLIARQAAQQGGSLQQQAAGQAATLQAQQSLNALGQLGGLANTQAQQQIQTTGNIVGAQQFEQQNLLNSIAQANNARVGMQSNVNQANAGLAGQQMSGQRDLLGNVVGGIGSAIGLADGGVVAPDPDQAPSVVSGTPNPPQQKSSDASKSIPELAGLLAAMASGGHVPQNMPGRINAAGGYLPVSVDYNNNDNVFDTSPTASGAAPLDIPNPSAPASPTAPAPPAAPASPKDPSQPKSKAGQFFKSMSSNSLNAQQSGTSAAGQTIGKGIGGLLSSLFGSSQPAKPKSMSQSELNLQNQLLQTGNYTGQQEQAPASNQDMQDGGDMAAKGGKVPAMVSPGEKYLAPKDVKKVKDGKNPMKVGETIPGKPKVKGAVDDYANDIVPKTLQEGGIVLPRSVTQSKNPEKKAAEFVKAIMAKKRHGKNG